MNIYVTRSQKLLTELDVIPNQANKFVCLLREYPFIPKLLYSISDAKAFSEPSQVSQMELFWKTVKLLNFFAKSSFLDIWWSFECASAATGRETVSKISSRFYDMSRQDSVNKWENTGQKKPVFWQVLRNGRYCKVVQKNTLTKPFYNFNPL